MLFWKIPDTLSQWWHTKFWLSVCGFWSKVYFVGNVNKMPYSLISSNSFKMQKITTVKGPVQKWRVMDLMWAPNLLRVKMKLTTKRAHIQLKALNSWRHMTQQVKYFTMSGANIRFTTYDCWNRNRIVNILSSYTLSHVWFWQWERGQTKDQVKANENQ